MLTTGSPGRTFTAAHRGLGEPGIALPGWVLTLFAVLKDGMRASPPAGQARRVQEPMAPLG